MRRLFAHLTLACGMSFLGTACRDSGDTTASPWTIYETNRAGMRLAAVEAEPAAEAAEATVSITIDPAVRHQTIEGIGGALTEASAYALAQLSAEKRAEVIERYFGPEGAAYSASRISVASCDFSVESYTYAPVPGDVALEHFTIERDRKWVLPLIKDALAASEEGFKIMASPWTAPPWMKDNEGWFGGSLEPEHYDTFARYLVRFLEAYEEEGVPIWALTPENEPLGNGEQWESMHFTPQSMAEFVGQHLGPVLEEAGRDPQIYLYDQNRDHVLEWAEILLADPAVRQYADGIAVHWYSSTVDSRPEVLAALRELYPEFPVLQSEGCIDALGDDEPDGVWLEDDWYFRAEATDWGYRWADEENKPDHPKYRPFHRYARDLIVGLDHGMVGWIDWNIVLDFGGGPNHVGNFCGAPVLVDGGTDTVYYTPLYYAMSQVSRYVRPGAVVLESTTSDPRLLVVAAENPDGTLAVVVFNQSEAPLDYRLDLAGYGRAVSIGAQGMQTLVLQP